MRSRNKKLGDVVDFIRGITFKPEDVVGVDKRDAVVCMRTKNIQEELEVNDLIAVPESFIRREELFLQTGDILISSANSWNLVGKVARVPVLTYRATAGGFIAIVRAKPGAIEPEYLYRWLSSDANQTAIRACGRQTTNISNLSVPRFLDLPITLPGWADQVRAATILGKADNLRRKRQEAIRLADEFLKAEFFDLVGDPVTNPRGWPERSISEIGVVTTGNTPDRSIEANFGNAIEWIKSDNINTPSHWLTVAREGLSAQGMKGARKVSAGATLMTCIAGSPSCIGNVAMADRRVAFNQQINAVTAGDGIDPKFLYVLLLFSKARIQAASTNSMKGMVSKGTLEKIRLIWPPKMLQERLVHVFDKVATLRSRMEDAGQLHLFTSLQAELLA
ncbi:MAG: restriction endonuclease subunit S [Delftia acidovorans]|uniref:restriction endonuclease subunit S n=1 Tax=Polaromonas sp. TaxID=1869339 RepID=UPI001A5DA522|nr:restriction endonuclease subunit S [Delftia acidovorans]